MIYKFIKRLLAPIIKEVVKETFFPAPKQQYPPIPINIIGIVKGQTSESH